VVKAAIDEAIRQDLKGSNLELNEVLTEPEVVSYMLWLLTRDHHPEMSPGDFRKLVTEENACQVFVAVTEAAELHALAG
jgi:hypothetical protein